MDFFHLLLRRTPFHSTFFLYNNTHAKFLMKFSLGSSGEPLFSVQEKFCDHVCSSFLLRRKPQTYTFTWTFAYILIIDSSLCLPYISYFTFTFTYHKLYQIFGIKESRQTPFLWTDSYYSSHLNYKCIQSYIIAPN